MWRSCNHGGGSSHSMLIEWILTRSVLLVLFSAVASTVSLGREALAGQLFDQLSDVDPSISDDLPYVDRQRDSDAGRGSMPEASNARLMSTWQARPVFSM